MKTWEVFKALSENPKRRFKSGSYELFCSASPCNNYYQLKHKKYGEELASGRFNGNISTEHEWEEIKQPVTWQEAVAAWLDGKTIQSRKDGYCYDPIYRNTGGNSTLKDANGNCATADELQNAEWYILD